MPTFSVNIGEVKLGRAKDQLITVLGSCVAVVMWHPRRRLGVMGHVLIPFRPPHSRAGPYLDGRYADECWQIIRNVLRDCEISPGECICHLIGGARMLDKRVLSIGRMNIMHMRTLLQNEGVQADITHTGSAGARMLKFHAGTGRITVKHYTEPAATTQKGASND